MALSLVGAQAISSLDDTRSVNASECAKWWKATVSEVCRLAPWSSLKKRVMLATATDYPPTDGSPYLYEWTAKFLLPIDCMRIVELNGNIVADYYMTGRYGDLFEVYDTDQGKALFCSPPPGYDQTTGNLLPADPADLKYIYYTDDTSKYDPLFVQCVAGLLAANIANALKGFAI